MLKPQTTRKQGRRDESAQPPAGKSLRKEEVHLFGRRKLEFPNMQISENQGILVGGGRVAEHEGRGKNTIFEELQNLFDITRKLVHKQGEILNVRMVECASPSWTRSSLAHDQAIKWSKAKVQVYSDSALCLGKMTGIDGEPIEFEWNISQDLRLWTIFRKNPERPAKTKH